MATKYSEPSESDHSDMDDKPTSSQVVLLATLPSSDCILSTHSMPRRILEITKTITVTEVVRGTSSDKGACEVTVTNVESGNDHPVSIRISHLHEDYNHEDSSIYSIEKGRRSLSIPSYINQEYSNISSNSKEKKMKTSKDTTMSRSMDNVIDIEFSHPVKEEKEEKRRFAAYIRRDEDKSTDYKSFFDDYQISSSYLPSTSYEKKERKEEEDESDGSMIEYNQQSNSQKNQYLTRVEMNCDDQREQVENTMTSSDDDLHYSPPNGLSVSQICVNDVNHRYIVTSMAHSPSSKKDFVMTEHELDDTNISMDSTQKDPDYVIESSSYIVVSRNEIKEPMSRNSSFNTMMTECQPGTSTDYTIHPTTATTLDNKQQEEIIYTPSKWKENVHMESKEEKKIKDIHQPIPPLRTKKKSSMKTTKEEEKNSNEVEHELVKKNKEDTDSNRSMTSSLRKRITADKLEYQEQLKENNQEEKPPIPSRRKSKDTSQILTYNTTITAAEKMKEEKIITNTDEMNQTHIEINIVGPEENNKNTDGKGRVGENIELEIVFMKKEDDERIDKSMISPPPKPPRNQKSTEDEQIIMMDRPKQCDIPLTPPINSSTPITSLERKHRSNSQDSGNTLDENNQHKQKTSDSVHREIEEMATGRSSPSRNTPTTPIVVVNQSRKGSVELLEAGHRTRRKSTVTDIDWFAAFNMKDPTTPKSPRSPLPIDMLKEADYSVFEKKRRASMPVFNSSIPPSIISIDEIFKCSANQTERKKCECNACHQKPRSSDSSSSPSTIVRRRHTVSESIPLDPLYSTPPVKIDVEDIFNPSLNKTTPEILSEGVSNLIERNENISNDQQRTRIYQHSVNEEESIQRLPESVISMDDVFGIIDKKDKEEEKNRSNMSSMARMKQMKESRSAEKMNRKTKLTTVYSVPETADDQYYKERRGEDENITNIQREEQRPTGERPMIIKRNISMEEELNIGNKTVSDLELKKDEPSDWKEVNSSVMTTTTTTITTTSQGETLEVKHSEERRPSFPEIITIADVHNNYEDSNYVSVMETQKIPSEEVDEEEISIETILKKEDEKEKTSNDWVEMLVKGEIREEDGINKKKYYTETIAVEKNITFEANGKEWKNTNKTSEMSNSLGNVKDIFEEKKTDDDESVDINDTKKNVEETNENDWITNLLEQNAPEITEEEKRKIKYYQEIPIEKNLQEEIKQNWKKKKQIETEETPEEDKFVERTDWIQSLIQEEENGKKEEKAAWNNSIDEIFIPQKENEIEYKELQYPRTTVMIIEDVKNDSSPRVSSSFDKDYFAALLTKYHSDSIEIKTEKDDLTDDLIDKKSVEIRNEKEEMNDLLTQVFDCSICLAASNTKEKCQCSACNIDELTPYDIEQRRKKQIEKTKQIEASQEMKNLSMEHSIQSDITIEDIFCQKSKEKDCKPIQSNVLITTEKEDTNDDDEISLDRILPHPSPPHESTPSPHAPSPHAPSPLPPSDPLPPIPSSTTLIDDSSLNNRYESRQYETRIYRENVILRRKKEDHQDQPRVISSLSVTLSDCTDPNPESNISPREISMDEIFSSINRDSIIYRKSLDDEEEIEQIPSTSHTYYNEIQSQPEECVKGNEINMDEILRREDSPERRYSLKHEASSSSSSSSDKESSSRDNSATTSPSSHRPLREFLSEHPLNLKQSMEDSMTEEEENTSKDDYLIYSGRRRGSLALEGRPVKDLCTSDTPIIPIITEWQKDNVLSTVQEIGSESTVSSTVPPASVSHVDDDIMSQVFNDQSIRRQISEKRMDDSVKKKNFDEDYIDCPDAFKELIERKHEQRLSRKHLDEYYDDPYDSPSDELDVVDFVDDILNQSMDEAAFFSASHNKQTLSLTDTSVDRKRSNQQNEDITKDDGYDHYYGMNDKPEGSNNKKIEDEKRENSQTYPTSSNMAIDPGYLLNSNGIMNDTQTSSEGDADDYFLKLVFSDKKTGEEQIAMLDKIDRSNQEEEISEERTTTNNITNTTIITSMETEVKAADEEILEIEVNSDFYIVKGHYSMIINKIDPLGQMLAQIQEGTGQPVSLDFTVTSRLRKALYNCLKDKILKKSSTGNEVSLRALEMLNDEDLTHKVYSDMSLNKFHPVSNSEGNINLCTAENNLCWDLVSAQFPRGGDVSSLVTEKHIGHYPPAGGHQSTKTVVKNYFHQVCGAMIPESEMVILPSINTSYDLVSFSLFEADDVILTATPMYPSIIDKCKERAQCRVEGVQLDLKNPKLIVEDYQKAVDKYSREGVSVCGIILINPHNPTGIVFPPDDVIRLCNWASKHNMHVIVDESFSNCVYGNSSFSSFLTYKDQLDKPNMTVFLWSLSKDFGLPGVKLGVVSSTNRLLLSSISRLELLFPVSALAHDFAIQLLQDHEFVKFFHSTKVSRLRCHYEFTKRNLSTLGLPFIPATAGVFVLVDFSKKLESLTVSEEISLWKDLCSHRVFLIPGTQMKNEMIGWMRIVFACTPQELEEGFHRLFRFFDVNTNSIGRIDYTAVPSTDSSVWMHNQNLETI